MVCYDEVMMVEVLFCSVHLFLVVHMGYFYRYGQILWVTNQLQQPAVCEIA